MSALHNSGTIILNDSTKEIFQNIYASQVYGSFFSVFGKFILKKNSKELQSLDLNIITYKGILDIEIEKAEIDYIDLPKDFLPENPVRKIIDLKIYIKASTSRAAATTFSVDISKLKDIEMVSNQLLRSRRELLSFYGKSMQEIKNQAESQRRMMNGGIFDTEFFYRNGKLRALRKDGDFALTPSSESATLSATGILFDYTASCKQRYTTIHI